jgi:hypothetical protein
MSLESEHTKAINKLEDCLAKKVKSMISSVRLEGVKIKSPQMQQHSPQRANKVKTQKIRDKSTVKPHDVYKNLNNALNTKRDNYTLLKNEDIPIKQIEDIKQDVILEYKGIRVNDTPKQIETITEHKINMEAKGLTKVENSIKLEEPITKNEDIKEVNIKVKLEDRLMNCLEPKENLKVNKEIEPIKSNKVEQLHAIFNTSNDITRNVAKVESYMENSILKEYSAPSSPYSQSYDDTQIEQSMKRIEKELKKDIELIEHHLECRLEE